MDAERQASPARVRRTQSSRRQDAERRILEAAVKLIGEQGIINTTFEEIGAEARCSRGLPRHYFGSKENLLVRIAKDITDQFMAALQSAEFQKADGLDKVIICLRVYLEAMKRREIARALMFMRAESVIAPAPLREAIEAGNKALFAILADGIREGQATASVRADFDPDTYSGLIGGGIRGITTLYLSDPGTWDFDKVSKVCEEFIQWTRVMLSPVSDTGRLRRLEDENAKLKRLLAEAMLDNAMLKDVASKKW
jgi:AcrR family transcriptional regulator